MNPRATPFLICVLTLPLDGRSRSECGPADVLLAERMLEEGKLGEARAAFEGILDRKPHAARAWWGLGSSQLALESHAEAAVSFERCIELRFNPPVACYNIACAQALLGDEDAAFASLDRAMEAGFHSWGLLERDTDLDGLRDDERFSGYGKNYRYTRPEGIDSVSFPAEDGVTVHADFYRAAGPAEPASAPTLVLMHQSGSNATEYQSIAPRLTWLGFHCLALDARGGGGGYGRDNRTIAPLEQRGGGKEAARDLRGALTWLSEEGYRGKITIWGSSYSAGRLFQVLAEKPERVVAALSFSPGRAFAQVGSNGEPSWAEQTDVPVFVTWPNHEYDRARRARFEKIACPDKVLHVQAPGAHGSSALNPERNPGGVEAIWAAVTEFLEAHSK